MTYLRHRQLKEAEEAASRSFPLRPDGSPYIKGPVWYPPGESLSERWNHSYARKLVQEIYNFPRRILATLERSSHGIYSFPPDPDNLPAKSYLDACSSDIESLHAEYPWAGDLDLQMAARAYQLGCKYASHILCTQNSTTENPSCGDSK